VQQDAKVNHWIFDLKGMVCAAVDWIHLAWDKDQRRVIVMTEIEVRTM
jgi:hypothetical protein